MLCKFPSFFFPLISLNFPLRRRVFSMAVSWLCGTSNNRKRTNCWIKKSSGYASIDQRDHDRLDRVIERKTVWWKKYHYFCHRNPYSFFWPAMRLMTHNFLLCNVAVRNRVDFSTVEMRCDCGERQCRAPWRTKKKEFSLAGIGELGKPCYVDCFKWRRTRRKRRWF